VVDAHADILIRPDLGHFSWLRFGEIEIPRRRGYEAAQEVLERVAVVEPVTA
jgi:hypothetical protein